MKLLLGLYEGHPSYKRSLQLPKVIIQLLFMNFLHFFVGHFCLLRSESTIRIRIQKPNRVRIQFRSGSWTLPLKNTRLQTKPSAFQKWISDSIIELLIVFRFCFPEHATFYWQFSWPEQRWVMCRTDGTVAGPPPSYSSPLGQPAVSLPAHPVKSNVEDLEWFSPDPGPTLYTRPANKLAQGFMTGLLPNFYRIFFRFSNKMHMQQRQSGSWYTDFLVEKVKPGFSAITIPGPEPIWPTSSGSGSKS